MMKRAILFDFDGTLIDSQPIIAEFMQDLYNKHDIRLDESEQLVTAGMSIKDFASWLTKNKGITLTAEDITVTDPNYLEKIALFPGARATLALIKAHGYKTALVTNSPRKYVDWLLHKYNLNIYFDTTITEDEALVAKPDPTMLEMAQKDLHAQANQCVMIDDNVPGIIAGNTLGMTTIRIGKKGDATYAVKSVVQIPEKIKELTLL